MTSSRRLLHIVHARGERVRPRVAEDGQRAEAEAGRGARGPDRELVRVAVEKGIGADLDGRAEAQVLSEGLELRLHLGVHLGAHL